MIAAFVLNEINLMLKKVLTILLLQYKCILKRNQKNQGYSGNQTNVIQGQRLVMENRHTQQKNIK